VDTDRYSAVHRFLELWSKARNVLVITGAGISTGAGIPDFRSSGGLYDQVSERYQLADPSLIFDIHYFDRNPALFYDMAPLLLGNYEPTAAHRFLARAQEDRGVFILTQNIDGLHQAAGSRQVLPAHGDMGELYCRNCPHREAVRAFDGSIPHCPSCGDILKPSVVFFGENLPLSYYDFSRDWRDHGFDLLLVIGTGLEVYPVAGLAQEVSREIANTVVLTRGGAREIQAELRYEGDIQEFFQLVEEWPD